MSAAAVVVMELLEATPAAELEQWHRDVRKQALSRRAYEPPRPPRRVFRWAIALSLLMHLALFVGLYEAMKPHLVEETEVMHVELIDAPLAEPALPEPPPHMLAPSAPTPQLMVVAPRVRSSEQTSARPSSTPAPSVHATPPTPQYRAYNLDGSLNVPKDLVELMDAALPKPNFIPKSTAPSPIMLPHRPMKIRPNYFADKWTHSWHNETLLGRVAEFIDDNLTTKKEFTTPWGTTVKCEAAFLLVIAGGACGWGFPPPPGGRPIEYWKPATVLDEQ